MSRTGGSSFSSGHCSMVGVPAAPGLAPGPRPSATSPLQEEGTKAGCTMGGCAGNGECRRGDEGGSQLLPARLVSQPKVSSCSTEGSGGSGSPKAAEEGVTNGAEVQPGGGEPCGGQASFVPDCCPARPGETCGRLGFLRCDAPAGRRTSHDCRLARGDMWLAQLPRERPGDGLGSDAPADTAA